MASGGAAGRGCTDGAPERDELAGMRGPDSV